MATELDRIERPEGPQGWQQARRPMSRFGAALFGLAVDASRAQAASLGYDDADLAAAGVAVDEEAQEGLLALYEAELLKCSRLAEEFEVAAASARRRARNARAALDEMRTFPLFGGGSQ